MRISDWSSDVCSSDLLATAGVKLVLAARRQDRLEALAKELSGDVAVFAADVAKPEVPAQLLAFARQRFGAADILINNAVIFRIVSLADFDLDAIAPMSALNYDAVVRASYVFARAMKAAGSGAIVNISSIGAHLTAPGAGVYGGLKRALRSEEHTSELQSLMRTSYAVFCLKQKRTKIK